MSVVFERDYSDESLVDASEDIGEIYGHELFKVLPEDEYGFKQGTFKITVTWRPD